MTASVVAAAARRTESLVMLGDLLRRFLGASSAKKTDPSDRIKQAYGELTAERYARARELALAILTDAPRSFSARLLLAQACAALGDTAQAVAEADVAIGLAPQNAEGYFVRGMIFEAQARVKAALDDFDRALALDPAQTAALDRKGALHDGRGEFEASLDCAQRLVALEPAKADHRHKLGITLRELGRLDDATAAFREAIALAPDHEAARAHLGLVLIETGCFDQAQALLDSLLAQAPENVEARWAAAVLHLLHGRYDCGWTFYEARESRRDAKLRLPDIPNWTGQPLADGALMVNAEQGLGDQIMFASCLPDLLGDVPDCIVSCEPRLRALLQRSFPRVRFVAMHFDRPYTSSELAAPVTAQTMLGDLPGRYRRRREQFPQHDGYLRADPEAVQAWRARLRGLGPGLKVGLSWTGGTAKTRRRLRSLRLDDLRPLLETTGCRFVSLQYVDSTSEIEAMRAAHGIDIHDPGRTVDYDQTAALVDALDLVITVCTSIAHLSGAMGKPVWIMAPSIPEWRYLLQGEAMPWYPSARIWRQRSAGQWNSVVDALAVELVARAQHHTPALP